MFGMTISTSFWVWLLKVIWIPSVPLYILYRYLKYKKGRAMLIGKVVLITGASSGLGEALAHKFYMCGCRLILASRRRDELERVKNDLMKRLADIPTYAPVVLELDLSDFTTMEERMETALSIFSHIDILINNGGISYRGDIMSTNTDVDYKVMLVNYFGQVAITKALLPSMTRRGSGHIITVSSVQGKIAIPHRSAYAASKHALQAFCDTLRAEVASTGVKVTLISPGYIHTRLSMNAITGSGHTYGVMDEATATGYTPEYVAQRILEAVIADEKDVVISSLGPRLAILLRCLLPRLYFYIMRRRAKKLSHAMHGGPTGGHQQPPGARKNK
ncbi:hypothetical protein WDU94_006565 [Cyamophila willieti]